MSHRHAVVWVDHAQARILFIDPAEIEKSIVTPAGHPKLLHLWPVKLPQAGRSDYADSAAVAMREAASFRR